MHGARIKTFIRAFFCDSLNLCIFTRNYLTHQFYFNSKTVMKTFAALISFCLLSIQPANAAEHPCASPSLVQTKRLLEFHFGADERISVDQNVEAVSPIKNPVENDTYDVLQVCGYIYKSKYRMRFIYGFAGGECVLMGQEILEYTNLCY